MCTGAPALSASSSLGVGCQAVTIDGVPSPFTVQLMNSSRTGKPR